MSQLGAGELGVLGGVAAMLAPEPLFTTPEAAGLYLERVSQWWVCLKHWGMSRHVFSLPVPVAGPGTAP